MNRPSKVGIADDDQLWLALCHWEDLKRFMEGPRAYFPPGSPIRAEEKYIVGFNYVKKPRLKDDCPMLLQGLETKAYATGFGPALRLFSPGGAQPWLESGEPPTTSPGGDHFKIQDLDNQFMKKTMEAFPQHMRGLRDEVQVTFRDGDIKLAFIHLKGVVEQAADSAMIAFLMAVSPREIFYMKMERVRRMDPARVFHRFSTLDLDPDPGPGGWTSTPGLIKFAEPWTGLAQGGYRYTWEGPVLTGSKACWCAQAVATYEEQPDGTLELDPIEYMWILYDPCPTPG